MSEEYKNKYEELMKRCAEFAKEVCPPTPYQQGFQDGWAAAKKEFDKDKTYVPNTTKPAKTMDLQWPRDYQDYQTTPFPPSQIKSICTKCGVDLYKLTHYVCNSPSCPSQIRWSSITTKGSTT
jgi:hypothetical protein